MNSVPKQSILLRSLALQLFLNYRTMQGPGYLLALRPLLKQSPLSEPKIRAAGSYINGHPVFSSAGLGAIAGRLTSDDALDLSDFAAWKREISTPMGAIGDGLIWERFKPGLLAVAAGFLLVAGPYAQDVWPWITLVILAVYNSTLWMFREWAFARGFELRERLTELAAHPGLIKLKKGLRIFGILAAAFALAGSLGVFVNGGPLGASQFGAGFLIMLAGARLRVSTLTAAFFTVLSTFGLYYLNQL